MRITINDIVKVSGFSKTTVSFAFNDPSKISKSTRDKILAIATEMGYVPDPVARSLSTKRKLGTIGLLLPQPIPFALENPYMVHLIRGVGEICNGEGLSLTVLPPTRGSLMSTVRTAAVDGLVTIGLHPEHDVVQVIRNRHIPFVTVDGTSEPGIPCVSINDREAASMAMSHLVEHGHRWIAVVNMAGDREPDQEEYSRTGTERIEGYREALTKRGIDWESPTVVKVAVPCSLDGGVDAGRLILSQHDRVTGIVCMSDIIAIGIVQELKRAGKRIPWDISVIGFDDIPEASFISPSLTTVWQPAEEKGVRAAELLVRMIHKRDVEERIEFRCRLVQRESVAEVASRAR